MRYQVLFVTALFVGCHSPGERPEPRDAPGFGEAAAPAPASAPARAAASPQSAPPADPALRTVQLTPANVKLGAEKFAACAGCHGLHAEGRVGIAPRLASETFLSAASDRMLVETITAGRPGTTMIPWGASMKRGEIEAIVAWLRSKAPSEPARLDDSALAGDVETGQHLFRTICATCHGRSGAGYQESGSGTGIGRKAFLGAATNGFLRHVIKHGKSNTQMRAFAKGAPTAVADLDDKEIESVIAYLRTSAW